MSFARSASGVGIGEADAVDAEAGEAHVVSVADRVELGEVELEERGQPRARSWSTKGRIPPVTTLTCSAARQPIA